GHDGVKVLNGGIQKWQAEGRPIETGPVDVTPTSFRPGEPHPELHLTGDELRQRLGEPGLAVLDVRRRSEYTGEEARATRGGRIPGATLLPWQENLNADWTFKSADAIRQRHAAAGVDD